MDGLAIFRNSRLLLGVIALLGVLSGLVSGCMLILSLEAVGGLWPISAEHIYTVLAFAFTAASFFRMSAWLAQRASRMARYYARLDATGIAFQLGTKRDPQKLFLPWAEITGIRGQRIFGGKTYRVETASGSWAEFSSYTFFRPTKLAKLISRRSGRPIERAAGVPSGDKPD